MYFLWLKFKLIVLTTFHILGLWFHFNKVYQLILRIHYWFKLYVWVLAVSVGFSVSTLVCICGPVILTHVVVVWCLPFDFSVLSLHE